MGLFPACATASAVNHSLSDASEYLKILTRKIFSLAYMFFNCDIIDHICYFTVNL